MGEDGAADGRYPGLGEGLTGQGGRNGSAGGDFRLGSTRCSSGGHRGRQQGIPAKRRDAPSAPSVGRRRGFGGAIAAGGGIAPGCARHHLRAGARGGCQTATSPRRASPDPCAGAASHAVRPVHGGRAESGRALAGVAGRHHPGAGRCLPCEILGRARHAWAGGAGVVGGPRRHGGDRPRPLAVAPVHAGGSHALASPAGPGGGWRGHGVRQRLCRLRPLRPDAAAGRLRRPGVDRSRDGPAVARARSVRRVARPDRRLRRATAGALGRAQCRRSVRLSAAAVGRCPGAVALAGVVVAGLGGAGGQRRLDPAVAGGDLAPFRHPGACPVPVRLVRPVRRLPARPAEHYSVLRAGRGSHGAAGHCRRRPDGGAADFGCRPSRGFLAAGADAGGGPGDRLSRLRLARRSSIACRGLPPCWRS